MAKWQLEWKIKGGIDMEEKRKRILIDNIRL